MFPKVKDVIDKIFDRTNCCQIGSSRIVRDDKRTKPGNTNNLKNINWFINLYLDYFIRSTC